MKTIIFILFLTTGAANMIQAQFLKDLGTKAKEALDNSIDQTSDKIVDRGVNKPIDNATDAVLDSASEKLNSLFKKKNKKNKKNDDEEQAVASKTDSTAIRNSNQNNDE